MCEIIETKLLQNVQNIKKSLRFCNCAVTYFDGAVTSFYRTMLSLNSDVTIFFYSNMISFDGTLLT